MGICCDSTSTVMDPNTGKVQMVKLPGSKVEFGSYAEKIYNSIKMFRTNPKSPAFRDSVDRVYQDLVPQVIGTPSGTQSELESIIRAEPFTVNFAEPVRAM